MSQAKPKDEFTSTDVENDFSNVTLPVRPKFPINFQPNPNSPPRAKPFCSGAFS